MDGNQHLSLLNNELDENNLNSRRKKKKRFINKNAPRVFLAIHNIDGPVTYNFFLFFLVSFY